MCNDVDVNESFLSPSWLRFSGGFHGTCVLEANMLQKSCTKIIYGGFPSIKFKKNGQLQYKHLIIHLVFGILVREFIIISSLINSVMNIFDVSFE